MTIEQTVEIPASRRITLDVPPEISGRMAIITFAPAVAIAETPPRRSYAEAVEYCASLFKRLGVNDFPVDKFLEKCCEGRGIDALLDLMQAAEEQGECPICAAYRDPLTGEERFNAETAASMRAMMRGEIPAKRFHSLAEMIEDLERDDPDVD